MKRGLPSGQRNRRWTLPLAGLAAGAMLLSLGGEQGHSGDGSQTNEHHPFVAEGGSHGGGGDITPLERAERAQQAAFAQRIIQNAIEPGPGENRAPGTPEVEALEYGKHVVEVARGEMLVRVGQHVDAAARAAIWEAAHVEVLQHNEILGIWRVRLTDGGDLALALQTVSRLPGVESADPNAIAYGATDKDKDKDKAADAGLGANEALAVGQMQEADQILFEGLQAPELTSVDAPPLAGLMWHMQGLSRLQADGWPTAFQVVPRASSVTVAILDSGLADAPSLGCTERGDGYDFVNDDADPTDDHQHGTHLASLLGADPRCGALTRGYAVGARILPVKVLGAELSGTEFQVSEGLIYAADQGADVINMSLSFGVGYQPGQMMQRALRHASEAGSIMVGSAGNSGADQVGWPAAAPHVIAVGAHDRPTYRDRTTVVPSVAEYSNTGTALEILAPGGNMASDLDGDGIVDGILAEAFDPSEPGSYGYWMAAGTSQAAVAVTGLAALMIERGIPRELIRPIISATGERQGAGFSPNHGNGVMRPALALLYRDHANYPGDLAMLKRFHVSPIALQKSNESKVKLAAAITVRENHGDDDARGLTEDVTIFGHWSGQVEGSVSCSVQAGSDHCLVYSAELPNEPGKLATFFVDRVQREAADDMHRWASPALGYYGLSQGEAQAILNAEGERRGVIFALNPDSEIAEHFFGRTGNSTDVTYNVRNLGPATALPPGVSVLNSTRFENDEAAAIADGNGLGSSSLVFDANWTLMYQTQEAMMYSFGNGLGSSSIPSDFSSLMLNDYSSLSVTSTQSTWIVYGNGLGSSSLIWDAATYVSYSTLSMSTSYISLGMSSGGEQVGMSPID
ncbi:MAG: S8 family peptidase [Bradymonadia bacterium]